MAGSYPDMPSRRIGFDGDQTVHYVYAGASHDGTNPGLGGIPSGAALVEATLAQKEDLNDETNDIALSLALGTFSSGGIFWFMFFPEGREIDGYYVNTTGERNSDNLAKSTDTTNGIDGTFSSLGSEIVVADIDVKPGYRNNIQSTAESNQVSVAYNIVNNTTTFSRTTTLRSLHVYGGITPGNTPDHLQFLNTSLADAQYTKPLDYGNIGRGTTRVDKIKIKNNSGSLTANTVQITAEDLVGGTPSGWFTFSDDNVTFQATEPLGNIGPGGTQDCWIKMAIPDAASLDLYAPRAMINQASWV